VHAVDRAQERMVAEQVVSRGVRDPVLLQALREVPREAFVSERHREFAWHDVPLPLDASVEVLPAFSVAMLLEASELQPGHRVLEIGTGAGYLTAVLSTWWDWWSPSNGVPRAQAPLKNVCASSDVAT